ncbi:Ion transport protein-domain-containing protein [Pavlovales sp. CCMP2436]|nr:Ion transport protein-domain-containing protein [Pavlovales sp. CCMP2436]
MAAEAYQRMIGEDRGRLDPGDEENEDEDTATGRQPYTTKRGNKYYGYVCLVFTPSAPFRRAFCDLIDWGSDSPDLPSYFDRVMMAIIGVSAIRLARDNPYDDFDASSPVELCFNLAFSIECVLVTSARGLIVPKRAYLQDLWGWLDLCVVIAGWLPMFFDSLQQVGSLRALRALRLIKLLKMLPGLNKLISRLLVALPQMANVVVLTVFVVIAFAVVGMQLFCDKTPGMCLESEEMCYLPSRYLKNPEDPCPSGTGPCVRTTVLDGVYVGINTFDTFFWAVLTVFECITMEGWSDVMYSMMAGTNWLASLYFLPLTLIGGYLIVQ